MKTSLLLLLSINTAWAHTGHSENVLSFALIGTAILLLLKHGISRLLKIKSDD